MKLSELNTPSGVIEQLQNSVDDPLTLIVVVGTGCVVFMAVLLKLAFISMERTDRKKRGKL